MTNIFYIIHYKNYHTGSNIEENESKYQYPISFYKRDTKIYSKWNHSYYYITTKWIYTVIIPSNIYIKHNKYAPWFLANHELCDQRYTANAVILGEKYSVFDIKTIIKFNININCKVYIQYACRIGIVSVLEYWKNSYDNSLLEYDYEAIDDASTNGHIDVLNWWLHSGLRLEYTEKTIDIASECSKINVLEWWKNSGLKLKYTERAFDGVIHAKTKISHDWWIKSGLKIKSMVYKNMLMGDEKWDKLFSNS
uniref:Ankyrin repeat protein n=1 Tax=viral metagenome TaxID=1070528 RepID=A0A6C0EAJ2_9ZZZZ